MNLKRFFGLLLVALVGGFISLGLYTMVFRPETRIVTSTEKVPVTLTSLSSVFDSSLTDFTFAAERTVHAVVHVKTQAVLSQVYRNPIYEFFYGRPYQERSEPVVGFGSGVIISSDGYIVTNNHVIDGAEKIMVTLNDKREFDAKLIGTDPSTDIALLKIEAKDLPFIPWGDSDKLQLGQWVLAVGNPFNLTSTVTAGIVSAKGRNLGILDDQYRIESFIQTDAALNKGNSGGALVDLKGELVGITSAIISPSGAYAGNSFAIPVSIVKKVVEDLMEFGQVQRAFLGVSIRSVDAQLAKEKGLGTVNGVYVDAVNDNGAAKEAGIKAGDVILDVNGIKVTSSAELQEQIGRYRPGQKVNIAVLRDNKEKRFDVVLRNMQGTTGIVKKSDLVMVLGATFAPLSDQEKSKLGISNGLRVVEVGKGKFRDAGISNGFIITRVNNKAINSVNDLNDILSKTKGGVYIEGVYPNGMVAYYAFGI